MSSLSPPPSSLSSSSSLPSSPPSSLSSTLPVTPPAPTSMSSPRRPTALPDLDAMTMPAYVDAAMGRLIEALDRRDAFAADVHQLALLGIVEGDLFGRGHPRPPRDALLVAAARFWGGLATLAGSGRATSLMSRETAAHWFAGPAAWPSTPSSLARFLSERHALVTRAPSCLVSTTTETDQRRPALRPLVGMPSSAVPSTRAAPEEVQRVDALLGWLAADLDARLRYAAPASRPRHNVAYAPTDAHVLWRAHDTALGRTLYALVDEATSTLRASSCIAWTTVSVCTATARPVHDVAPSSPWSGTPLAMAFAGLTGADGSGAPRVAFVDLAANLRQAIMAMGAAGLPMRSVRVPPDAMQRAIARGRAVWTALDLRTIIDTCRRLPSSTADSERYASTIAAAAIIRETLAVAIDDDAACDAAGRPGPRAACVLGRPFWDAARVFGVEPDPLGDLAAVDAVGVVAGIVRGALDRHCSP
ncbi:hypothetical protein pqer_cds_579 [Pandoravirus quercus]|uniref:Uncharacterized protein n=1 Tax=Pandoravirus quercus TaxID=2107709 RepID=A0A2U7U982_9VIRU|nr:hypothetical protein pqer_cds_579 [Pandoravirus quercus]AVK75001.1 hypothetical protein pqer_cds_579 [Pandoravirus quercus]